MSVTTLAGLLGPIGIGALLWLLGRLSQRLGRVTRSRPYFIGLYVAAMLVWLGTLARLVFLTGGLASLAESQQNRLVTLLGQGLPALGLTLGVVVIWYYWSWLLAERD